MSSSLGPNVPPTYVAAGTEVALLALLEVSQEPAFALDRELRYTAFNGAHAAVMEALYGVKLRLGDSIAASMTVEADRAIATANLHRCLAGERVLVESGSGPELLRRIFQIVHQPLVGPEGRIVGVAVFARDLTDQRRAEALLRLRVELAEFAEGHTLDELLQLVLAKAEEATGSVIGFFHFVDADQQGLELQSWSRRTVEQFCRASPEKAHYPIAKAGVWADAVRLARPVVHDDYEALPQKRGLPEGHARILREVVVPILRGGIVVGVLGVGNKPQSYTEADVAAVSYVAELVWQLVERTRARDALRESEARLQAVFQSSLDALVVLSPSGVVESANAAARALLGVELGTPREALLDPDDARAEQWLMELAATGAARGELRLRHADGRTVAAVVAGARCETASGPRTSLVLHDLTEQRRLQATVAQSDRLASMGMLAAGVAHEINNPLTYVLYNLQSLVDELPPEDDHRQLAHDALDGARRVKEIARSLGSFARVERSELCAVDLNEAVRHAADMAHNEIKYRAGFVKELAELPPVRASEGRLAQLFLNLLVNAAHAIKEGDVANNRITVRTWATDEAVFGEVSDTGHGIDPAHAARLFEPFFTTKAVGVGSGLGLSICRKIATEFGGEITFRSKVGEGTSFLLRLPLPEGAPPPATSTERRSGARAPGVTRRRVLVVDDEGGIRRMLQRSLGQAHEVHVCASGQEAQELLAHDRAFDLLLLDVMMPQLSGAELHGWLASVEPALASRVVFMSGGVFTPDAREWLERSGRPHLEKPFDPATLEGRLADLLAGTARP